MATGALGALVCSAVVAGGAIDQQVFTLELSGVVKLDGACRIEPSQGVAILALGAIVGVVRRLVAVGALVGRLP